MSFAQHLARGALLSVFGLASSASRNLDRLALDAEHAERIEALRAAPSRSLGGSLGTGLSALGLSLLSAFAFTSISILLF